MLTRKQYELLVFLDERLSGSGVAPSFEEMKDALGLRSKSGIHRLISALEERGFIRRLPHRARALEILRRPGEPAADPAPKPEPEPAGGHGTFQPRVIQGDFSGAPLHGATVPEAAPADSVQVPLLGKIAAGTPIAALSDATARVDVPAGLLGHGDHYALTVEGDSMVEAGILDGDTVVIHSCDSAESGVIVVALIDDEEATLKRLRRKGHSIALEPANANYRTQVLPADRVKVQGRLVGLLRRY
ncbi:transcriptional repressor LexA [Roseospira marina]|uniref:LexA repressor n=1 Tax=Roseospira marina TaxID=140057 RepID=A0A5M6I7V4_9PROT|nr:transcriptional repressor LexA [Roseospira marina]KAA5604306.1 transcriptional repressor LexA [Roseospira marina]MBB4315670.1 repressor LexA [Roseospira marina]MBB5088728.1 repressor LexA [Roseospira marina]